MSNKQDNPPQDYNLYLADMIMHCLNTEGMSNADLRDLFKKCIRLAAKQKSVKAEVTTQIVKNIESENDDESVDIKEEHFDIDFSPAFIYMRIGEFIVSELNELLPKSWTVE